MHKLLFHAHTLCRNYVTNTFLLIGSSGQSKQLLCFVHPQGQKSEQKHTTKNFVEFHNHSPLFTLVKATKSSIWAGTMHPLSSNHANTIARLTLTAQLLFQYGIGLGYYSNMASASGALLRAD